jgi:hypothetical protein
MRAIVVIAAAVAALLPLGLARAGDESVPVEAASAPEPAHQLLGDWRAGRELRLRISGQGDARLARLVRDGELGGCRLRRGTLLLRGLRFAGRIQGVDRWHGQATLPDADCERSSRPVVVTQGNELRLSVVPETGTPLRMRRVRPRARVGDPVLGAWERNGVVFVVERARRGYVARARDAFLISNGCTIPANSIVWRLRPLAPARYDGTTRTFAPPPGCEAVGSAPSVWRLGDANQRLVRRAPDGTDVVFDRVR